jgi:hypothetical protein
MVTADGDLAVIDEWPDKEHEMAEGLPEGM